MSAPDTKPSFVARWSRRKRAAEAGQPLPEPPPPLAPSAPPEAAALPDPATLNFDDDFSAYLGAQVPAALKRAALSKLFADPSFNRMDGLDVYIENYNLVPDLSAEERDLLAHARQLLRPEPPPDGTEVASTPPPARTEPTARAAEAAPRTSEPAVAPRPREIRPTTKQEPESRRCPP